MFQIKCLSKKASKVLETPDEVMHELRFYVGNSVAVHQLSVTGMIKVHFIDVMTGGVAKESYGSNKIVTSQYFA